MCAFETDLFNKLNRIIDENLDNPSFSIEYLCKELGTSRANLHRKIKEVTDLSTSIYIRKRRMLKAKELVESSDLNFSEIAYSTGINNPQNFSKYFQEEYGLTPSQYRKTHLDLKKELSEIPDNEDQKLDYEYPNTTFTNRHLNLFVWGGLVLVIALSLYWYSQRSYNAETSIDILPINSLAVLPFSNFGPTESAFFSDGVMEDILTNLARFPGLKVISRTSSMKYRNTDRSLKEIAQELNVNYVLEGSVRQYEDQVKITVQLIKAEDDTHMWAQDYSRKLEDIFSIQADVSKDIALQLNQNLTSSLKAHIERQPTQSFSAYNDFIIGRELIYNRTENSIKDGLSHMDKALEEDNNFADALAFKALGQNLLGNLNYVNRIEIYEKAIENSQKAIQLDPQNDIAYLVLASVYSDQYKWKKALTSYRVAFKLNPNNALAYYWYSLTLRELGDLNKAKEYSRKAIELDPLQSIILGGHIVNCAYAKDYDQAEEYIEKGRNLFGNSFLYYWGKARYEEFKENYVQAVHFFDKALELNPNVKSIKRARMFCLAKIGKTEEVNEFIVLLDTESPQDMITLATIYCGLDDKNKCLHFLEKAYDQNVFPDDIKVDPKYAIINKEPKFIAILKKSGLLETYTSK